MKTLCIKIGSGLLLIASLALLVFAVHLNIPYRIEKRIDRRDVLELVGKSIFKNHVNVPFFKFLR